MKAANHDFKTEHAPLRQVANDLMDELGMVLLVYDLRRRRPEGFVMRDERVARELREAPG